jgi:cytoskeletal protein RodZ
MSLASIGQKLKSAREAQGLTLVQVYERTKIPLNHLQAVEEGDTEDLPEPVYILGFIKRYADCVGLDGQVLSDDFRTHLDQASGNGRKKNSDATPYYASNEYIAKSKVKIPTPTYKMWLFNSIIIVGVVGAITWFVNGQNQLINQTDPNVASLRSATQRLAPVAPPPSNLTQPAQPGATAPAPADTSQKVTLTATRHVWVEVKRLSNGDSIFTGNLERGDRRDFQDPQGLLVRAGDGGGLSVENQGKIETFGLNGKVTERQFVSSNPMPAATAPGVQTGTAGSSSTLGSGSINPSAARPAIVRPRVKRPVATESRPRPVERRIDSGPSQAPARYSEGRLDSD